MQTAPVTLFKGDDLIVKGHFYQVQGSNKSGTEFVQDDSKEATLNCVEFDFIVRVNGKLCEFTESFSLCEQFGEPSIYEWSNWYLIVRILNSLGYYVGDEREVHESTGTLKQWLRSIIPDGNTSDTVIKLPKVEE